MAKFFFDTEFLEGSQKILFGMADSRPTIDLISIGIVCEDTRKYYAISKDFNLKEAWNRYDLKINTAYPSGPKYFREYWIRENVLRPIFHDLCNINDSFGHEFTYDTMKNLLAAFGKSNKQIAEEIKEFVHYSHHPDIHEIAIPDEELKPKFYGYYADYDWVVFCWLFGKMIDLPKGFPMYCRDLKQMLDEKLERTELPIRGYLSNPNYTLSSKITEIKWYSDYPKNPSEHNALVDAEWNYQLYNFIQKL